MTSPAAALLQWLDEKGSDVMQALMAQHGGAGLDPAVLHTTAAAMPVCLQIDVTALASNDVQLAMELMHHTEAVEAQATALINQQLASMFPANPDDDLVVGPPSVRVCLQMHQVPLPLLYVPEVTQQVVASAPGSSSSSSTCVSLLAVVTGVSSPAAVCHSQRFHCPSCGQLTDAPCTASSLPCCNIPKTEWLKEDITGRLMVQTQMVWVSELSSATGRSSYGISSTAIQVHLPEALVDSCSLGQVVHVIGHAHTSVVTGAANRAVVQVKANNLQLFKPQTAWDLGPAATASLNSTQQQRQQPLHCMWELLTDALGYHTALDPHLAVAMLLSAAAAGGSNSQPVVARQREQVNLVVLHEAFSPSTPRLLREAAALLSPQSVAMPVQQAEHVTPITGNSSSSGTDTGPKALFASILQLANSGIAAAELALMTSKSRTQLLQALQQHQTPLPKDMPPGLLPPRLTATCWAAASWQEVCAAAGEGPSSVRPAGRKGGAAGDRTTYHGFDLCIGDGTVHEDDLWGLLDVQAATPAEQFQLHQSQHEAAAHLRHLIAAAVTCDKPVLSEGAQAFLGQAFLLVRESVDGSSHVSKPHLLSSLVAVASAAARLHQRSTVLECPDAALAVVLMEHTLANKLGDAYHSLLDLPCDLCPSNGRSLDEQLQLLHGVISRAFRARCPCAYDDWDVGGAMGGGGDSGVSGCGCCGAGDDEAMGPEE